ncbi:MAG TPA: hypothetical protein VGH81_09385 [Rudaea sp.]
MPHIREEPSEGIIASGCRSNQQFVVRIVDDLRHDLVDLILAPEHEVTPVETHQSAMRADPQEPVVVLGQRDDFTDVETVVLIVDPEITTLANSTDGKHHQPCGDQARDRTLKPLAVVGKTMICPRHAPTLAGFPRRPLP